MKPFATVPLQTPRSGIREIMERAAKVKEAIHLEVGQPDFPTPQHIVEATCKYLHQGYTKYVPNAGLDELREAVARYFQRTTGITTEPDNILITTGAITSCMTGLMATCDPGDQVLLPDPGWPNYEIAASLVHAKAVRYSLKPQRNFLPDMAELESLVTAKTKLLLSCSPSNPTGQVYDHDMMGKLVDFCHRHDQYLLSDEIYSQILFDTDHTSALLHDNDERTLIVSGVSKAYSMTGFRIGFTRARRDLIELGAKLQEPLTSCASGFSQMAARDALEGNQQCIGQMTAAYKHRRDIALEILREYDLYRYTPGGAFYLLVDVSASGLDGREFALRLLDEQKVAVAPGTTFGNLSAGHVRISFAAHEDEIKEGMHRLCKMIRDRTTT